MKAANLEWGVMRPKWEAQLAAAALRDELHGAGRTPIFNFAATAELPDGRKVETVVGGLGSTAFGQRFPADDAEATEARLRAGAAKAGVAVASLEILHPEQYAPAIVVTVGDRQKFMSDVRERTATIFGDVDQYEGLYFEARDSDGPFFIATEALRAGAHGRWSAPEFARPLPIPNP